MTVQTGVRQLVSPGRRPTTLVRRRTSPKVRSMKFRTPQALRDRCLRLPTPPVSYSVR
jgi:hypothetical protein